MFLEWTALEDIVSLSKEKVNFYTVQYEKDDSWEDKSRFLWLEILVAWALGSSAVTEPSV